MNTSEVPTKSTQFAILLKLITVDELQIVTGDRKNWISKRLPSGKHYIVYPEIVHRQRDLGESKRRRTRARLRHFIRNDPIYS